VISACRVTSLDPYHHLKSDLTCSIEVGFFAHQGPDQSKVAVIRSKLKSRWKRACLFSLAPTGCEKVWRRTRNFGLNVRMLDRLLHPSHVIGLKGILEILSASRAPFFVTFLLANVHDKHNHVTNGQNQQQNRQRLTKRPLRLVCHLVVGDRTLDVDHKHDIDRQEEQQTDSDWLDARFVILSTCEVVVTKIQSKEECCRYEEIETWYQEKGVDHKGHCS
jgi:hypothetical protein